MYNCGPTVYNYAHIGNLRAFVFADTLRRMFEYNNFEVKQVINITDVGHLTSDEDTGEDKLEKSASLTGKTAQDIASYYTKIFYSNLSNLGIEINKITFPKATDNIKEQIELIKNLEKKGATYKILDGVYFDTSKLSSYGELAQLDIKGLKSGARIKTISGKKNITDFALWKFSNPEEKRQQEWDSPWGIGFPGWHIECSAMSMKYLGEHFDIHTGGIDLIPVHHTNEIAQSETATGKHFVNYWMHSNFINMESEKMSKSLGNIVTLENITDKDITPLAYRFWLLTAHYNTLINFTWESITASQTALDKLYNHITEYKDGGKIDKEYQTKFNEYINDNLDTPKAIALLWKLIKDDSVSDEDKKATVFDFDKVLGLDFNNIKIEIVPENILELAQKRNIARESKDWNESDELREELKNLGYKINDTDNGYKVTKSK